MNRLVIVRGGGDLASGTIYKLKQCGFLVLVLECERPSAIRRNVSFSEAVYEKKATVEGMTCYLSTSLAEAIVRLRQRQLTMLIDPLGKAIEELKPFVVVDAILAKRNLGTNRSMANITIALGPGFVAGKDVDAVIETMRGHCLGRVLYQGSAIPNTGVPGRIAGYDRERVIHSPSSGIVRNVKKITDIVEKGDVIAWIEQGEEKIPVVATMDGLLRGLIRDGYSVSKNFKMADIDPRLDEYQNCFTISDKARCIAGGVVEAILHLQGEEYDLCR